MKAHSQGPRCPPWSWKASRNEWGCIILNGNIWGSLPWNLLGNRQNWSMGRISMRRHAPPLSLAAWVLLTGLAQVGLTEEAITLPEQQFPAYPCRGLLPSFSIGEIVRNLQRAPQPHSWAHQGLAGLIERIWACRCKIWETVQPT